MKHNVLILSSIALAAIAVTNSCADKAEVPDTTISFNTIGGSAAYRLESSARDFARDSDLVYFDSASLVMPVNIYGHDITALQNEILKAAFDTVCPNFDEAMAVSFGRVAEESGYETMPINDNSITEANADGLSIVSGDVFSLTSELLTYRISTYVYLAGAAHGMSTNTYLTYLMTDGQVLALSDIFTSDGLASLPQAIAQRASKLKAQLGPTDIAALPSNGNYYIGVDGAIVFVYQPYEVASYAQGEICVPFYPYELTELMTPAGRKLLGLEE